jgi:GntR family transcriptional regulator
MHATSWLPRNLTRGTAIEQENTGPGGLYARLEEAGHTLTPAVERVATRKATVADAELIRVEVGDPLLYVTRIARDTTGTVVEAIDMTMAGDRYELIYEVPVD